MSNQYMKKVTLNAPAKINLTLDIIGKRYDGYHLVKMLMQTITLFDKIEITLQTHGNILIHSNSKKIPLDETNIAFKAAKEFFNQTKTSNCGIDISIVKSIPISAGLAGGSTDAAAVIIGLNHLFNTNLQPKELCDIASNVGADVPFCLLGGTMIAEGIGTTLTPLPDMPECFIVLTKPNISVSTKKAYELHDKHKTLENENSESAIQYICNNNLKKLSETLHNSFEKVLNIEEVNIIKKTMLSLGALGACMSGSGPTVFSLFDNKEKAQNCFNELHKSYPEAFLCKPSNRGCMIIE